MSPATNAGNGTVKFQANMPETVSLAFADGREVTSPYTGDQVMFTLDDGRRMYVAPFVADKIRAAGIGAHQPFEIVKAEVRQGNRRTVEFQVKPLAGTPHVGSAPPAVMNRSQSQSNSPDLARALEESIARAAMPAVRATPAPAAAADPLTLSGRMAIDAVLEIERYATAKGMDEFVFGPENVQKIWMSLYIELCRKGARL